MINLRAFVNIASLMGTTPGAVSTLGELSPISLTYSTLKQDYDSSTLKGYRLISFNSVDVNNNSIAVPQSITDQAIGIVDASITYSTTNPSPLSVTNYIAYIVASTTNAITNVTIGNFINQTSPFTSLPEWISYTVIADGSIIKLWLCDASFQAQYDLYSITVIPPIANINDFFGPYTTIETEVPAVTITQLMQNIQTARHGNPETDLVSYTFNYISPVAGNAPIPTNWSALVYGLRGDNIDDVKNAIQAYIAANGPNYTQAQWQTIFPDIYATTEFVIVPRWDRLSIPNTTTVPGLYSVITNPSDDITNAISNISFYTSTHVTNSIKVMTHYYKYLAMSIVNGPTNVSNAVDITAMFPDYIPESSTSLDYNRMTSNTQGWVSLLETLLSIAETATPATVLPANVRLIYRNSIPYIASIYNNVDYIVALKSQFISG